MPMNKTLMKGIGIVHAFLYRASGGRLGGRLAGHDMLLLTTVGRKSGRKRTAPLLARADGENWIVMASQGGHDDHPKWYLNLRDHPDVEVQVGSETKLMRAETAEGEERERLWKFMTETYPNYDKYQKLTTRVIPVVVLKPA